MSGLGFLFSLVLVSIALCADAQEKSIVYRLKSSPNPHVSADLSNLTGLDPDQWTFKIVSPTSTTLKVSKKGVINFDRRKFKFPCVDPSRLAKVKSQPGCALVLKVEALQLSKKRELSIVILLGDDNDFAPEIKIAGRQDSEPRIRENEKIGKQVMTLNVTDKDEGRAGRVFCSLRGRSERMFSLMQRTSGIYVVATAAIFDRERYQKVAMRVLCTDSGSPPRKTIRDIIVSIVDVNDNAPAIMEMPLLSVREGVENAVIAVFHVKDNDSGDNGQVKCHVVSRSLRLEKAGDNVFKLYNMWRFDREMMSRFMVRLVCRDNGAPSHTTVSESQLNILDVNDNAPRFPRSHYTFMISEGQPKGILVGHLRAVDMDAGLNAQIRYSLDPYGSRYFTIDEKGLLRTNKILTYEKERSLRLQVYAIDKGTPPLSATATLLVKVEPVRRKFRKKIRLNPFKFSRKEYSFKLRWRNYMDVYVGEVLANNYNKSESVRYSLNKRVKEMFHIHSTSGVIRTGDGLRRDTASPVVFAVYARDSVTRKTASATVSVTIQLPKDGEGC